MTRSPLAYPLNRSADMDGGGAADLQTDIMRFMAILSLCLVAIFALVQSIPMTPAPPVEPAAQPTPVDTAPIVAEVPPVAPPRPAVPESVKQPVAKTVTLTRPKWVPKFQPAKQQAAPVTNVPPVQASAPPLPEAPPPVVPPVESEAEGFTLRFESDAALTRLVAASHVGLYAIESSRAQRMTVSNSRISFWDASTPNTFHEMETATVPAAVLDALTRTGTKADAVSWGVTLPGKLKTQLDDLMQAHGGGALVIGASGDIRWEAS
ncbi:MAG: hypothetical protein WBM80_02755 [Woeseiaceae bacterium]